MLFTERGMKTMRGLEKAFMDDLKDEQGKLRGLLDFVQADDTLSLEIRDNYINLYYRGGSVYKISPTMVNDYDFSTDAGYFKDYTGKNDRLISKAKELYASGDYLQAVPFVKAAIDRFISNKKSYGEKEVQQLTVYENNRSPVANSTHYYITDFEYANMENGSRFDLVAIKWSNKRNLDTSLCVMEAKLGYHAVDRSNSSSKRKYADTTDHLDDAIKFFADASKVEALKHETVTIFNQKQDLGLIAPIGENGIKKLAALNGISEFMLWLVNYPPNSTALKTALDNNKEKIMGIKGFDFVIASSSYAGYALFDDNVIKVKDFMGW
jgi:hypothetical protein